MTCSRVLHCYKRCPTTRTPRESSICPIDQFFNDDLQHEYILEQAGEQNIFASSYEPPSFQTPSSLGTSLPSQERHVQFDPYSSSGGNLIRNHAMSGTPSSAVTQQYRAPPKTTKLGQSSFQFNNTKTNRGAKIGRATLTDRAVELQSNQKKPSMVTVAVQTDLQDINETLYVGNERSLQSKFTAVYAPYFLQPQDGSSSYDTPIKLISLYNLLHANEPDSNIANLVSSNSLPVNRYNDQSGDEPDVYADGSDDSRLSATNLLEAALAAASSPACLVNHTNSLNAASPSDPDINVSPLNSSFATQSSGLRNVFAESDAISSQDPGSASNTRTPVTPLSLNASYLFPSRTMGSGIGTAMNQQSAFNSPSNLNAEATVNATGHFDRSPSPAYMFPWNSFFESSGKPSSAPTAESKKPRIPVASTVPAVGSAIESNQNFVTTRGHSLRSSVSSSNAISTSTGNKRVSAVMTEEDREHQREKEEEEEANAAAYLMRIRSGPGHLGADPSRKTKGRKRNANH